MSIHVKSTSIMLIVLGLSFIGFGCADLESNDLDTTQGQKKYGQDEYGDSYDWLEGTEDDSYDPYGSSNNTDNGTNVYEPSSSNQDNTTPEYDEREEEQNNEYVPTTSTTLGGNVGEANERPWRNLPPPASPMRC